MTYEEILILVLQYLPEYVLFNYIHDGECFANNALVSVVGQLTNKDTKLSLELIFAVKCYLLSVHLMREKLKEGQIIVQ